MSDESKAINEDAVIQSSIAPWLSVRNSLKAVEFYKAAFGAVEAYRLDVPEAGPVVRLSVNGAEFWVSEEFTGNENESELVGGETVKMILTVQHPDEFFKNALSAGALEIFAVGEDHGWRLGRLVDPFGLHWEIGRPIFS